MLPLLFFFSSHASNVYSPVDQIEHYLDDFNNNQQQIRNTNNPLTIWSVYIDQKQSNLNPYKFIQEIENNLTRFQKHFETELACKDSKTFFTQKIQKYNLNTTTNLTWKRKNS